MTTSKETNGGTFTWAVPQELGIPPDQLRLRLDFFHQATMLTYFEADKVITKMVDAIDVAHALATDLTFSTGLLPKGTLWWQNTKSGPVYALYNEPQVWKMALETEPGRPPKRYVLPMPGLLFLCSPSKAPWLYAVKKKPTKETDTVFRAPLPNIYDTGRSCPGSHHYPNRVEDMVQSFFMSFFTEAGHRDRRSVKYPADIILLWNALNGKKNYPMEDLVSHGTIKDLMTMPMADVPALELPDDD